VISCSLLLAIELQTHQLRYAGSCDDLPSIPGTGVAQTKDAFGTFQGGYEATFTGTLNPSPTYRSFGDVKCDPAISVACDGKAFDFQGTKADILLGTYGNGQTGSLPNFDYTATYFTGVSGFTQPTWGWDYHYRSQLWHNFSTGTTGDIVV
jgi:hypothetical protein